MKSILQNKHPKKPRGAALLLVLGAIVLLSFLTLGILRNMQRELLYQADGYAKPQLELAAKASLETCLAVISNFLNIDGAIYAPQQGWSEALSLAGFEYLPEENCWRFNEKIKIAVQFRDESGRYALAQMDAAGIVALLSALGINTSDAEKLADCLLDWTDADDNARINGAEIDDYEQLGLKAFPPNTALRELSELKYILHFNEIFFDENAKPNELFHLFKNAISLDCSSGKPNINTATDATLIALTEDSGVDATTILEYKESINNDGAPQIFRNANDLSRVGAEELANKVSFSVRTLRIVITAYQGDASFVLDTLVEISRNSAGQSANTSPFKIIRQTTEILQE